MDELKADKLADELGGQCYRTDEDVWVVVINRRDGRVAILTDRSVDEYANWQAFKSRRRCATISLV